MLSLILMYLISNQWVSCQAQEEVKAIDKGTLLQIKNTVYSYALSCRHTACCKKLMVNFTRTDLRFKNATYEVLLRKLKTQESGGADLKCDVEEDQLKDDEINTTNTSTVVFNTFTPGSFCLGVRPFPAHSVESCKNGCDWEMGGPFRIGRTQQQFCAHWCGTIHNRKISAEGFRVKFTVFSEVKDCFHAYDVILLNTTSDNVNCLRQHLKGVAGIKQEVKSGEEIGFTNLLPGSYCVHIDPVYPNKTPGEYEKIHRFLTLPEIGHYNKSIDARGSRDHVTTGSLFWIYVAVITIGIIAVIFSVWFCWSKTPPKMHFNMRTMVARRSEETVPPPKVKVLLLCLHSSEEFENLVHCFVTFLRVCWNVEVTADVDEEHLININGVGWILKKLHMFLGPGDQECDNYIRKVIVIESKGAAEWQRAWEQGCLSRKNDDIDDENEHLNFLSQYGLAVVASNPDSLSAHGTLIVLRFPFTTKEEYFNSLVPNVRYVIPDNLPALYHALHNTDYFKLESEQQWKYSKAYLKLLEQIENMTQSQECNRRN